MAGIQKRLGKEGGQDSGETGRFGSDLIHIPVLLEEIIQSFDPMPGQKYIDATLGAGGHTFAIWDKIRPGGRILGIEWDSHLARNIQIRVQNHNTPGIVVVNDSYVNIKQIAERQGFMGADGILMDLGMSSWHIDLSGKGFSFSKDEPLDMRYSSETEETAANIVNSYQEKDLANIIYRYGEERFSRQIAKAIVEARRKKRILTTFELVEVIKNAVPFGYRSGRSKIHFATRTFQGLRIAVNHELENIAEGLRQSMDVLKEGGKLAVITFHSLEDRIVKTFFIDQKKEKKAEIFNKKPTRAKLSETITNPRARSAKLRVLIKI